MKSLREEILEECVKAEAHKPSQIIPIAISVFEKRIDSLYPKFDGVEVNFNYGYTVALDKVKEMLK